jgi:hypothetical protein
VHLGEGPLLEACCLAAPPANETVTVLILLSSMLAITALFVVHLATFLSGRSQSRKLEPALRAALAERDYKEAADLCERYKSAASARVISSMIAQSENIEPSPLARVEEFKRVWLSTAATELLKWMRPAEAAHWIKIIVILAPALNLLLDTSLSLNGIDLISGEGSFSLYLVLWRGLPLFSFGILLAILAFALEQMTSRHAIRLKFLSDDLAIEFLVNCVGNPRQHGPTRYMPGSWMGRSSWGPEAPCVQRLGVKVKKGPASMQAS